MSRHPGSRGADGAVALFVGTVRDDEVALEAALREAAEQCDAIVTSGGVSMGDYDVVKAVLSRIADMRWMQIAIKPAKHYYTPSWAPDSKKLLFSDTDLNVIVMDVAAGTTKVIGNDPWMVPQRTLYPTWSPDSKWVAYAARLNSLYRAIFVANVETGERKQVTDGLADAMYPVWDAGGKYLWFLASTDFGLRSQWLDMTSYDRTENFGLYLAVLKKGEPSPLLPESDEDKDGNRNLITHDR